MIRACEVEWVFFPLKSLLSRESLLVKVGIGFGIDDTVGIISSLLLFFSLLILAIVLEEGVIEVNKIESS